MVHDDSHRTLRASADNVSRRAGSIGMRELPGAMIRSGFYCLGVLQKISNYRDMGTNLGIISQSGHLRPEFIPMHSLDAIDRKILSILQTDSRATMQELA